MRVALTVPSRLPGATPHKSLSRFCLDLLAASLLMSALSCRCSRSADELSSVYTTTLCLTCDPLHELEHHREVGEHEREEEHNGWQLITDEVLQSPLGSCQCQVVKNAVFLHEGGEMLKDMRNHAMGSCSFYSWSG